MCASTPSFKNSSLTFFTTSSTTHLYMPICTGTDAKSFLRYSLIRRTPPTPSKHSTGTHAHITHTQCPLYQWPRELVGIFLPQPASRRCDVTSLRTLCFLKTFTRLSKLVFEAFIPRSSPQSFIYHTAPDSK